MGQLFRRGVVWSGVVALALAGCAGQGAMRGDKGMMVGSGNPIADRQALMKLQGASMKDISDKLKAGNVEAVAVNADTLILTSKHIPSLFPAGSVSDKSRAKPEIWQKWTEFQGLAGKLGADAERLKAAAAAKDTAAAQAAATAIGREACGACHNAFRKPAS